MKTNFITPCPVYPDGGAHACGPIEWGPGEKRASFEVFLVQEDAIRERDAGRTEGTELWEPPRTPRGGEDVAGLRGRLRPCAG